MAFYVIEYEYKPQFKFLVEDVRPAHRTFLRELEAQGNLLASGFFRDSAFDGAMLIVKADTAEQALALLENDPFATDDLVENVRVRLWVPTLGPYAQDFDTAFPIS